ncbi:DUF3486 family protein [Agarivorans sp. B2Z047]|uniref:DUF3486 family protein n=1 Tax=Agarivorans sp. B2Z047 TaxID=2652721 RepID=UPI00128BBFEB|nr:DUF3486 family protein [Agarivorans sp. B2Z047]MPW30472.1 DUF3486 family protein [Agarivorans sp. B2Z047]UQN42308.1 DUF3486 family protein [Agarivorans sp. B2Z047]
MSKRSRKSKVELLPQELRDRVNMMLRGGEMHQIEIVDAINQLIERKGLNDDLKLSKTGFNRYAKRMEKMGAQIKQARQVAEVWSAKLGEAPASDLGKLLQEFVRTMAFETSMHYMESDDPVPPKALGQLALVSQRIEAAAMASHKVEKELRATFAEEAAEAVEKIGNSRGLTADTVAEIKRDIFGLGQ